MNITDEQKTYIKEHPYESPYAMAKSFGCAVQTVYWWLHRLHRGFIRTARKEQREKIREYLRKLYPDYSSSEISRRVWNNKVMCNKHSKGTWRYSYQETEERLRLKCALAIIRPEMIS